MSQLSTVLKVSSKTLEKVILKTVKIQYCFFFRKCTSLELSCTLCKSFGPCFRCFYLSKESLGMNKFDYMFGDILKNERFF